MNINWNYPKVRGGFWGGIDKLIGPGATKAEKRIQLYIPALAGVAAVIFSREVSSSQSLGQVILLFLLTIDIVGGIITNATSSAKRWFHREGQGVRQHLSFVAVHFVQLSLVASMFLEGDWLWVAVTGGYMMMASWVILMTPLYLQRPIALMMYAGALLLSLYWFGAPVGLEWFLPLFYLKLLVSHILREEPYRPESDQTTNEEV
ncbi:hypothetical protein L4C42_00605 [Vibrio wakamikoensis]|uniref:Uncharacterized protein n=1 Tax=Vibrio chaetopteri TaxID=3016528 RepID=A0AAU8BQA2_9VIBR